MSKFYKALEVAGKTGRTDDKKSKVIQIKGFDTDVGKELIVVKNPDSVAAEYFRFLRSWITRPAAGKPPRTILVTSALMQEGKTFVACNLAASVSQSVEESALLIDADIRNPKAHKLLGIRPGDGGLASCLEKNVPFSDVLVKTCVEKLTFVPAGTSDRSPAELLTSDKMKKLVADERDRYSNRYVVIDSPPLELTPETAVVANFVDAVILVVMYGKTPRHCVKEALEKIPKEKFLGIVFNASEKEGRGRYGRYKYGYGKEEKD